MKRTLSIALSVMMASCFFLLAPAGAASGYSVEPSAVNMSSGVGSFSIKINKTASPYGGVRIYLQMPAGVILSSGSPFTFDMEGLRLGPNTTEDGKISIEFSTPSENGIDRDLTCVVNIAYASGADKSEKSITVDKIDLLSLTERDDGGVFPLVNVSTYSDKTTVAVRNQDSSPPTGGGGTSTSGSTNSNGSSSTSVATGGAVSTTPGSANPVAALDKNGGKSFINGYPDGTFGPDAPITRAETSSMLYSLISDNGKSAYKDRATAFNDVPGASWYAEAVGYLSASGVIQGYPDGTFGGGRPITRAEFATIMARLETPAAGSGTPFSDVTGHWAYDGILSAYGSKWITGYPDNTFHPDQNITRAEAVTIVNRVIGRDKATYAGYAIKFGDVPTSAWYYGDVLAASSDKA
jgi:hypothetical protein